MSKRGSHAERCQGDRLSCCADGRGDPRLLERIADPPGFFDVYHDHGSLHGGGHVDFPRGRGQERRHEKGEISCVALLALVSISTAAGCDRTHSAQSSVWADWILLLLPRLPIGIDPVAGLRVRLSCEASRSHVLSVTPLSRSLYFCTLPLSVLGSSRTNSRYRGTAK